MDLHEDIVKKYWKTLERKNISNILNNASTSFSYIFVLLSFSHSIHFYNIHLVSGIGISTRELPP